MREILFRGKRTINGDWLYGDFVHGNERKSLRDSIFVYDSETQSFNDYEINPSTLGQYTGLTDKNGKRIFEGDILSIWNDRNDVVVFEDGAFIMEDTEIPMRFAIKFDVIGNVHDNPELLEK